MRLHHVCVWLISISLAGCQRPAKKTPATADSQGVRITPAEFFTGDLKRLKDHVDFEAVCFKTETHGSLQCDLGIQMWCDGERVDIPKYGSLRDSNTKEISVSWRRERQANGRVMYRMSVGGMISFGRNIEEPVSKRKIDFRFGPIMIENPVELRRAGDSAVVWALGTGANDTSEPADLTKPDKVEKMLNRAPWVLILRLTAEKEK
jgi:hypothetical protein